MTLYILYALIPNYHDILSSWSYLIPATKSELQKLCSSLA